jgi:hypothetical protein
MSSSPPWVNVRTGDAIDQIRQVISHDNFGFDRSLGIDARTGGQWSMFAGSQGTRGLEAPVRDVWTFVAPVFDQLARTVTSYVNGNSLTVTNADLGSGHDQTRIGSNPGFGEFFDGPFSSSTLP